MFRPNVDRSRTFLDKYRVPLDELLNVAVTHELGHAICHEADELKATEYHCVRQEGSSAENPRDGAGVPPDFGLGRTSQ